MRRRIVILATLAAVLAITLFGIPLAAAVARANQQEERTELEQTADRAAITVAADAVHGRRVSLDPVGGRDARVGVYDAGGDRIAGGGPARAALTATAAHRRQVVNGSRDGRIVIAVPIRDDRRIAGVVLASSPDSEARTRTLLTWLAMAGLGVLAVGLTWLIARWQAHRLAAPLEDLSAAAQQLGDGNFAVRAAPSGIEEIDAARNVLNSTAERLGSLLERERAFSADASHQLRTPLTGLRLSLDAALTGPEAGRPAALRDALAMTDRLDTTVEDLLALARDREGRREPIDVRGELEMLRSEWETALARQGRTLAVRTEPDLPHAVASAAAVRQVLAVLVDNAARHGAGTIELRVREAPDAVAIDVCDQGAPIDTDPARLFERSGDSSGHGIGLALARALAEAEGGRLQLTGTDPPTFTLFLSSDRAE